MRNLERRGVICLLLAAFLLVGLVVFVSRFVRDGGDWATAAYNGHIYEDGRLASGNIYDRNGELLLGSNNGKLRFNKDENIRRGTAHAVGDPDGNVSTGAESVYRDLLVGYNLVTGTYSIKGEENSVTLSIDKDISAAAYTAMAGRKGLVGVYNYKTGEILCMVSTPSFDPKKPPKAKNAESGTFMNKFLLGTMTPGSTFKLVTSAAAIENFKGIKKWSYTCTGVNEINGEKITCTRAHGEVDFESALAHSCNCGFAEITEEVGAGTMKKYVKRMGLTGSYQMDDVENAKGSFEFPSYAPLSLAWAGIGQWKDQVNPCSMMVYMSAIARGDGIGSIPRTLHSNKKADETEQMIEASTAKKLRKMMKNNVESEYGTYNYPGLDIYAKSGTAEVGTENSNAWFCGFIRNEEHPYAFIVCVENSGFGSQVAGPVANQVLQAAIETNG